MVQWHFCKISVNVCHVTVTFLKRKTSWYVMLRSRFKIINVTICHATMMVFEYKRQSMSCYDDNFNKIASSYVMLWLRFLKINVTICYVMVTVLEKNDFLVYLRWRFLAYGNGLLCDLVTFFKRNQRCIKSDGKIGNDFYVYENRYHLPTVTVFNRH